MKLINKVKTLLPQGRFARSVAVLAGGAALGQALSLLAAPFITRLYTPEDFGVLAVYASFLGIFSVIAGLRYELAIPLPEDDKDALNILVLTLGVVFCNSVLVGLGTWLFGSQVLVFANAQVIEPYLGLLPLGVLMVGTYQAFNYWAVRKKTFSQLARTRLNQGIGSVLTQVGLGLFGTGPIGLILGQVVGQAAGVGTLARSAYESSSSLLKDIRLTALRREARRYKRFPMFTTWAGFANTLSTQLPTLLFAALFSPEVAGLYMFANRILSVPLGLVGNAVGQVFHGRAAAVRRSGELADETLSAFKQLVRLGLAPLTLLIVGAPEIFMLLFGEAWRFSGTYAQWLLPSVILTFITSPLSTLVSVMEYQVQGLVFQFSLLSARVAAVLLAAFLGSSALAVGLYGVLSFMVYLGFMVWLMKAVGIVLKDWLLPFLRELALALPLVLSLYVLKIVLVQSYPQYLSHGVFLSTVVAMLLVIAWRVLPAWR